MNIRLSNDSRMYPTDSTYVRGWPSIPERELYIRFEATSVKAQTAALRTERKYSGREREYKTWSRTVRENHSVSAFEDNNQVRISSN